jgi:hypothetical protein
MRYTPKFTIETVILDFAKSINTVVTASTADMGPKV